MLRWQLQPPIAFPRRNFHLHKAVGQKSNFPTFLRCAGRVEIGLSKSVGGFGWGSSGERQVREGICQNILGFSRRRTTQKSLCLVFRRICLVGLHCFLGYWSKFWGRTVTRRGDRFVALRLRKGFLIEYLRGFLLGWFLRSVKLGFCWLVLLLPFLFPKSLNSIARPSSGPTDAASAYPALLSCFDFRSASFEAASARFACSARLAFLRSFFESPDFLDFFASSCGLHLAPEKKGLLLSASLALRADILAQTEHKREFQKFPAANPKLFTNDADCHNVTCRCYAVF
jgi:hypothetical protein